MGTALYASVGRQVVNWGKGLFLQGVDQINPLDVNALRRPGTQLKDALIPAALLYGKLDFAGSKTTLEGFYQFQWEPTALEACGTYFTSIDNNIGPNTASSGCPSAIVKAPDATGYPARLFVPLLPTTTPRNGGQFGVSLRQFVEPLQTEVGFYAMNIHSRTVVLNGIRGEVTFQAQADATGKPNVKGRWVYPENIQYYGVSAATRLAGWALGAELSHTPNLPVQVAVGDAIAAMLYPTLGVPSQYWGPLGPRMLATPVGGEMQGYDRARKTMLLLNGVKTFQGLLGAQALTLAGEAGLSWAGGLNPDLRYGRGYVFGTARSPTYGPFNTVVAGDCPLLNTPNQPGCAPEGFATALRLGLPPARAAQLRQRRRQRHHDLAEPAVAAGRDGQLSRLPVQPGTTHAGPGRQLRVPQAPQRGAALYLVRRRRAVEPDPRPRLSGCGDERFVLNRRPITPAALNQRPVLARVELNYRCRFAMRGQAGQANVDRNPDGPPSPARQPLRRTT